MIDKRATFLKINKYFKRNKISIFEIQKYLKKKGFNANKKNIDSNSINILSRTFLSSLIIISIFFISPIILEFKKSSLLFSNDFEKYHIVCQYRRKSDKAFSKSCWKTHTQFSKTCTEAHKVFSE